MSSSNLDVRGVPLAVVPGELDGREESVGVVELAGLEGEELRGEGLQPQQVVEHEGRGGVVRAVVERRDLEGGTRWNHSASRSQPAICGPWVYCHLINWFIR